MLLAPGSASVSGFRNHAVPVVVVTVSDGRGLSRSGVEDDIGAVLGAPPFAGSGGAGLPAPLRVVIDPGIADAAPVIEDERQRVLRWVPGLLRAVLLGWQCCRRWYPPTIVRAVLAGGAGEATSMLLPAPGMTGGVAMITDDRAGC